jgi:hypothetical protein
MSQKYIDRLKLDVNRALEDPSRPSFVKRALPAPVMPETANAEIPSANVSCASGVDDALC